MPSHPSPSPSPSPYMRVAWSRKFGQHADGQPITGIHLTFESIYQPLNKVAFRAGPDGPLMMSILVYVNGSGRIRIYDSKGGGWFVRGVFTREEIRHVVLAYGPGTFEFVGWEVEE